MSRNSKKILGWSLAALLLIPTALIINKNQGRIIVKNPYDETESRFQVNVSENITAVFYGAAIKTVYIYPSNRLEITYTMFYYKDTISGEKLEEALIATSYVEYISYGFYPVYIY